jgi:hypothetical protein
VYLQHSGDEQTKKMYNDYFTITINGGADNLYDKISYFLWFVSKNFGGGGPWIKVQKKETETSEGRKKIVKMGKKLKKFKVNISAHRVLIDITYLFFFLFFIIIFYCLFSFCFEYSALAVLLPYSIDYSLSVDTLLTVLAHSETRYIFSEQ